MQVERTHGIVVPLQDGVKLVELLHITPDAMIREISHLANKCSLPKRQDLERYPLGRRDP